MSLSRHSPLSFYSVLVLLLFLTSSLHQDSISILVRDLQKLREEFWHQQMKIDEMNFLKQELTIEGMPSMF